MEGIEGIIGGNSKEGGGAFVHLLSTWTRGGCKMSTLVHSRRGGGQNWVKFGPRSC